MNNPVYKFFFDELESHEIQHYSNGNPIEFSPSTPELKAGAERIIKELEKRGYRRMRSESNNSVSFSKPEYCMAAYVGTTVNPFTFTDKIWWWTNKFAISEKMIVIREVYRGNGATKNATVRISVYWRNSDKAPKWYTSDYISKKTINDFGIEIPKTYDFVSVSGTRMECVEIRKFRPDVSDKVLKNILDKAEEEINKIELFNPACWEADCNDYPADTTKEYWEEKNK